MQIRKLEASDAQRLEAFLREVPEDDRTFFKEDLADPESLKAQFTEDVASLQEFAGREFTGWKQY